MHLDAQAGAALVRHLRALGIGRDFLAAHTEPGTPDTLLSPLRPTRAAQFSPDPAVAAFRALFCGMPGEDAAPTMTLADAAGVGARFHLRLVRGLFLFSDYLGSRPDAAMGAGETTALLYEAAAAEWTSPGRLLDLGCGAGTLALLSSKQHSFVIGADINPRAVALARFNAAINGIANVEFRQGDLYQPVRSERFYAIVSQPPYYPLGAMERESVYLHGGVRGHELARRVIEGAPEHLTVHGRALVFCAWPADEPLPSLAGQAVAANETGPPEIQGTRQVLIRVTPSRER